MSKEVEEKNDAVAKLEEEKHELQHVVIDLEQQLQAVRQEHAISMTNELTALRKLVPYLVLENETLSNALSNNG